MAYLKQRGKVGKRGQIGLRSKDLNRFRSGIHHGRLRGLLDRHFLQHDVRGRRDVRTDHRVTFLQEGIVISVCNVVRLHDVCHVLLRAVQRCQRGRDSGRPRRWRRFRYYELKGKCQRFNSIYYSFTLFIIVVAKASRCKSY